MSLIASAGSGTNYSPIEEGTHLGVCSMMVDVGVQENATYKSKAQKIVIGWEIPGETIELDDGPHPRTISKIYTNSLGESANLRQDLAAWRGRDFTPEELAAFDLRRIVGTSCLINIVHQDRNGKTYANIQSIMALPKGMAKGQLQEAPMIFDLDTDPLENMAKLPKWVQDMIAKSETYQARLAAPPKMEEIAGSDEDELPF